MTNNIVNAFLYLTAAVAFLAGCSKSELMPFEQKPQVYIYKKSGDAANDSTTYSFATQLPETVQDTFYIPIRVGGLASDQNRTVNYEALAKSTAPSDSYELLPAKIAAGAYSGVLPIRLIKNNMANDQEMRLWIKITSSADFEPGAADQLEYLLKVTNHLTKPSSWVQNYFGDFSQVKYGLIIRETGYTDFSGTLPSVWFFIMQKCKNALIEYKQTTGKDMVDELGNVVTFPF